MPRFDTPIPRLEGRADVTIDPPLDQHGRGVYVSNVCAPMASKKSFHSRIHAWVKRSISAVLAVRVSYALNAAQEWRESSWCAPRGALPGEYIWLVLCGAR